VAIVFVIALSGRNDSGAAGVPAPSVADRAHKALSVSAPVNCRGARKALRFYSRRISEHRQKMGLGPHDALVLKVNLRCPRYLAHVLKRKAKAARLAFERWFERTYEKWACIHRHEGRWDDPNPPHYGGLQFDDSFQRTYGPEFYRRWGDAGNWPVYAQLLAAERAYRTRGFGPWPNTRRMCGV
jgi:hypothetical protein